MVSGREKVMSQIDQFLGALKRTLKSKNILYKDLAQALGLSESSIKRILASKSLSLTRLEEICKVTDISFAEVCRSANFEDGSQNWTLTDEQEEALSENARLLHYYILLYDGKSPQKIEREYEISNADAKKFLFQLDHLNLIELHPRDRVKMKRQGSLRFRREGAVGKALFSQTKSQYLNHSFSGDQDFLRFNMLTVTKEVLNKFKVKLGRLASEIQEEARFSNDSTEPQVNIGIMIACRPWQYSYMDALKKK